MNKYLKDISLNFEQKDQICFAKNLEKISYPENDNNSCYRLEDNSFWFKHRNNCIFATIQNFIKKDIIFDIGGGNGFVSKFFQDNNIETFLVEPGIAGILNAKKRGVKNLINANFDDNFNDNSIPNIGIFDVLEHIENDVSFLQNIHNKLENNGLLFITVPAYQFLWSDIDRYSQHYRRYPLKSIKKTLNFSNFKIIYSTYFFNFLPLPIFLFRTLPSFFAKNFSSRKVKTFKTSDEHKSKNSKIINFLLNWELKRIKRKKTIHFGGSCLIVAQKK